MSTPASGYSTVGKVSGTGVVRSTCTFNCAAPMCSGGNPARTYGVPSTIIDDAGSPNGPVEFRSCSLAPYTATRPNVEYVPSDSSQHWSAGNICGGNNCFYDRCTKLDCTGP